MARKGSGHKNTFLNLLDALTDIGLKLGGVIFLASLVYLMFGLFKHDGIGRLNSLPAKDRLRVVGSIAMFCQALGVAGTIVALSAAARFYAEETLGYMMSGLGVVLYFCSPWAFSNWLPQASLAGNEGVKLIASEIQFLGMMLFVPGIVLILRDLKLRLETSLAQKRIREYKSQDGAFLVGKDAERGKDEPYKPRPYAKCWQMPYCRDFVRNICPAYETHKPCWRIKRGCYCDEKTILRAMKARGKEAVDLAKDLQYRADERVKLTELTPQQKRQLCRNCVIYQLHQQQKYRLVSPLVFPITAAILWALYPTAQGIFREAVTFTDQFMNMVSFLPQEPAGTAAFHGVPDFVLWVFVVWIGLIVLTYGLRLVEYCIFKLQV
jgi:hypothetical protein